MMMVDLVLEKLPQFVRPADIVGAIANEAQVGGSQIGKILINKKRGMALVQVAEEAAQTVLKAMKAKKISGVEVTVSLKDRDQETRAKIRDYINRFKNLLYLERGEELVKFRTEIRRLSGEERQAIGHALLQLYGRAASLPVNDYYQVRFTGEDADDSLPCHRIRAGDMVIISKGAPLAEGNAWGTVVEVEPGAIVVGFRGEPPAYVYGGHLRLDLAANDQVFQMTVETLKNLFQLDERLDRLRGILLGETLPEWGDEEVEHECAQLDEEQRDALIQALQARDMFLITGGAGTGKTTIGVEILVQHVKRGKRVLAVGTSPASRDELAEKLQLAGLRVLKLCDVDLTNEPEYYAVHHLRKAVQKLCKRRDELQHPGSQWAEGLSYKEILDKAATGKQHAGVPSYRLKEMAEWIQLQQKIDEKLVEIDQHREKIWERLLQDHDLICGTHYEVVQARGIFDLVVIDDAHRVNEPELLTAYFKGMKVILLGDVMQIPPRVINSTAREEKLDRSLFSRLLEELDDEWSLTLKTQHRLPRTAWRCLGSLCQAGIQYAGDHQEMVLALSQWRVGPMARLLENPADLTFLDTSAMNLRETQLAGEYVNQLEAELILEILQTGVQGVEGLAQTAVLTFYQAQVDLLQEMFQRHGVVFPSVYTAENFCGNEKDLIVISLVHSNSIGYLGQCGSIPHMITALTRARKKCMIVGNLQTFCAHPIYQNLLQEIQTWGYVYTL